VSQPLRLGVIGCGEVAQSIHLPTLRELPQLFEVAALCDVSSAVLDAIAGQWSGATRYTHHRELLADARIDAVLIANHSVDHASTALDAVAAGKHILLEKPMCINLREADWLQAAEVGSGLVVQVGFMRRYAPAFTEAVERVRTLRESITLARVHDVIGMNSLILNSLGSVARRSDLSADARTRVRSAMAASIAVAIGHGEDSRARAYEVLLGLGSHDISAMRELLGSPKRVLFAAYRHGGFVLTAAVDYGHYVCQIEIALDHLPRFDTHLEVYTEREVLRVDYDTPYIRHIPARLHITGTHGTAGITSASRFPTRRDSFAIEWQSFHENICQRRQPKTSIADAREDLILFRDMIGLMA
jgi:predicted dehydrogenase